MQSLAFPKLIQSLGVPDPNSCLSTEPRIVIGQSNALTPVTEHILELAFTKATIIAAGTGMLHEKINLKTVSAKFPGAIQPTLFTDTLIKHLTNPPALIGDNDGLTQPGRRLMWVLGSLTYEDHFVVAEAALNSAKMRVSDKQQTSDLQLLLNILYSSGTMPTRSDKQKWIPRSRP